MNPATADRPLLSVVVPARNEEANLPRAYDELTAVLGRLPCDYEVLVIDNASTDRTGELAAEICARDGRWRYLRFSRNFHVEASITAGLYYARGDAAVVVFSDLQDPPELIPEFVRRWREGFDVVYGVVRGRAGDPAWKSLGARLIYRLVSRLADAEIPADATDFRLLSRRAIDALNRVGERNRYLRGLAHWIGFRSCAVPYDRRPRTAGRSKASVPFLFDFAANAVTCFSIRPLQLLTLTGAAALAGTAAAALAWLVGVPGLTAVHLLLLTQIAVTLLGLGVVGEYVGRTYVESKGRPLFLVDRTINLDEGPAGRRRAA